MAKIFSQGAGNPLGKKKIHYCPDTLLAAGQELKFVDERGRGVLGWKRLLAGPFKVVGCCWKPLPAQNSF